MESPKPPIYVQCFFLLFVLLSNLLIIRVIADSVTAEEAKHLRDEVLQFWFLLSAIYSSFLNGTVFENFNGFKSGCLMDLYLWMQVGLVRLEIWNTVEGRADPVVIFNTQMSILNIWKKNLFRFNFGIDAQLNCKRNYKRREKKFMSCY